MTLLVHRLKSGKSCCWQLSESNSQTRSLRTTISLEFRCHRARRTTSFRCGTSVRKPSQRGGSWRKYTNFFLAFDSSPNSINVS